MDMATSSKEQKHSLNISHILGLVMLLLVLVLVQGSFPSSPPMTATMAHGALQHNSHTRHTAPTTSSGNSSSTQTSDTATLITTSLAKNYMNAFLASNFSVMWSLLHPDIQAKWPSRAAFASFWKKRFASYTLSGYTLGHTQSRSYWVDPETMHLYSNVYTIPISLSLQPSHTLPALSFPPENVRPTPLFRNTPFMVQHFQGVGEHAGRWAVLVGGPADTEAPLLPPITPVARSLNVPILMYHHISDNAPAPNPRLWTVTIERFTAQLDYLQAHGYHSITFNQLFNALYYGGPLPNKPIIFTFDDGLADSYQQAYPILQAHHFSGMFYIVSGKVGWDGQMTWPQLREMLAHGMQMGAHTIHHVNLAAVLLNSQEQSRQELQIPPLVMRQQLGIVIQHFCYPYGEPFYLGGRYQRQQVLKLLPATGYIDATVAVGTYAGITQKSTSPFTLPRVPVFGFESLTSFAASLPWT